MSVAFYSLSRYGDFDNSVEDVRNVFHAYYRVPTLSFRNALFHSMAANASGYKVRRGSPSARAAGPRR